jgi:hypothetical protein
VQRIWTIPNEERSDDTIIIRPSQAKKYAAVARKVGIFLLEMVFLWDIFHQNSYLCMDIFMVGSKRLKVTLLLPALPPTILFIVQNGAYS